MVEKTLHAALMADPRRAVSADEIAAIADADARENWQVMIAFRDQLMRHRTLEAAYLDIVRTGAKVAAHLPQSARARDPAQRARRLRGSVRAARRRTVLPHPAHDPARRLADRRRRGNDCRHVEHADLAARLDARHSGRGRDRHHVGRQRRALFRAQRPVSCRARPDRRTARTCGARRGDAALDRARARRRGRDRAADRAARGEIHLVCRARLRWQPDRRSVVERRGTR